jgi:probable F420-dependent oxidoreductase
MKVDAPLSDLALPTAVERAVAAERAGFDGVWTAEGPHDPFLPLVLAAEHTETIEVGTSIAVAFARNPMLLANLGWDLQTYSRGRFILGLGSQIKPHITRRFSMPWSRPAARMRELVMATRSIWDCWLHGTMLEFRGEFYTHTLMTPIFVPEPSVIETYGLPPVYVAGVGPAMTETAGEVGDGFLSHGFTSARYLEEVTLPALRRGRATAGLTLDGFVIGLPAFVVTGVNDESLEAAASATKMQMAFYGSTPAYAPVLELHGWADLHLELNSLSKRGRWSEMGELIDDEVLHTLAVVGHPDVVVRELGSRYGGLVDRLSFMAPYRPDPELFPAIAAGLKKL